MRKLLLLALVTLAACAPRSDDPRAAEPAKPPAPLVLAFTIDAPARPQLAASLDPASLRDVRVRLDPLDPATHAGRGPTEFHGPEALHIDATRGDFELAWDGGRPGLVYHVTVLDDGRVLGETDVPGGAGARVGFRAGREVTGGGCIEKGCLGDPPDDCFQDTCDPVTNLCFVEQAPDGTRCHGGVCTAGVCSVPMDDCSNARDGERCDDGTLCTNNDYCQAGRCVGSTWWCGAPDACHASAACDPTINGCNPPPLPDGTPCDDGNACTTHDACNAGRCMGTSTCAGDACHDPGTCNPATGTCTPVAKPDGASCDDGNPCTSGDVCTQGSCAGTALACPAQACRSGGVCDPSDGQCHYQQAADGAACDDHDACTHDERCLAGTCTPEVTVHCGDAGPCADPGVCNPATGYCEWNPRTGNSCDDGNPCTENDRCQVGNCVGSPRTCAAKDACHVAGVCRQLTGECSNPLKTGDPSCVPVANPPAPPEDFWSPQVLQLPWTTGQQIVVLADEVQGQTVGLVYDYRLDTPVTRWGECLSRVVACYNANPGVPVRGCIARVERCEDPRGGTDCCPDACIDAFFQKLDTGLDDEQAVEASFIAGACIPGFPAAAPGGTP